MTVEDLTYGDKVHLQTFNSRGCLWGRFGKIIDRGVDSKGRYRIKLLEEDWAGKQTRRWYLAKTHTVVECWRDVAKRPIT